MRLIFISSWPISKLFGTKLDAWWFSQNGFEVEFWDVAGLFYPAESLKVYFGGASDYLYIGPGHQVFDRPEAFRQAVAELPSGAIVWHLSRFFKSVEDDWLFEILQSSGVEYLLQHFDTMVKPDLLMQKARFLLRSYKQRYLNRKLKPCGVVGSGVLGRVQSGSIFPDARFISIPSIKVLWQPTVPLVEEPYNLFVDESVDYAPDAKMMGHTICSDTDAYYERLNKLFDDIEEWSGFPIVVAASGKYHYTRDRFNGRRLIYGQTLSLIQNAQMVIGHMSLALDQCLVSEKPVLIVDDPDFTDVKRKNFKDSLMHFVMQPVLVTNVSKAVYSRSLLPRMDVMKKLVRDYLREDAVSFDYYTVMKRELLTKKIEVSGVGLRSQSSERIETR